MTSPEDVRVDDDSYVDATFLVLFVTAAVLSLAVGGPSALGVLREGPTEYVGPVGVAVHGGVLLVVVLLPLAVLCLLLLRQLRDPSATWARTIATAARAVGALAGLSVLSTFLLA